MKDKSRWFWWMPGTYHPTGAPLGADPGWGSNCRPGGSSGPASAVSGFGGSTVFSPPTMSGGGGSSYGPPGVGKLGLYPEPGGGGWAPIPPDREYLQDIRSDIRALIEVVRELAADVRKLQNGR